jgi:hypothetical protein
MPKPKKAVSADEQLEKMEAELAAETPQEDQEQSEDPTFDEDSPPSEEKDIEEKLEEDDANDSSEDLSENEISSLSERAQKRFREMAQRLKELEQSKEKPIEETQEDSVVDLGEEFPIGDVEIDDSVVAPSNLPWNKRDNEPAIDPSEYKRHVARAAKDVVEQVLTTRDNARRNKAIYEAFKSDLEKVRSTYPELNDIEAGPRYDNDLAEKVATYYKPIFEEYKNKGKYYRFDAFVKDWMSVKERGRSEGADEVRSAVDKQDGEQAFRPSGESISENPSLEKKLKSVKNIDELEALESELSR